MRLMLMFRHSRCYFRQHQSLQVWMEQNREVIDSIEGQGSLKSRKESFVAFESI